MWENAGVVPVAKEAATVLEACCLGVRAGLAIPKHAKNVCAYNIVYVSIHIYIWVRLKSLGM